VTLRAKAFRPFATGGRRTAVAILLTIALLSAVSVALTIAATGRSQHRASVVEVAARQRTLAERYVQEVLLVKAGEQADPAYTAQVLRRSATALLDGGSAPAVNGDDDETTLSAVSDSNVRAQLEQERRLVNDLTATGAAMLAGRPVSAVPETAHERIDAANPIERLRTLAALTSNVSLNAARMIADSADQNISDLIVIQVALGVGGLLVTLLLAWALIATTRRQTAHFQSLVQSSSDLVMVLGSGGCRYASRSLTAMVGHPESELLGSGYEQFVHEGDRPALEAARQSGQPGAITFRMLNAHGEWRHLEAHLTDLRGDRHVRGIVLNARDTTERVRLEEALTVQAHRDSFGNQLGEALEMADEEGDAYEVVERSMVQISPRTPMELLLSDSSRANLERVAASPGADAPGCPVKSPFSCVAVRRGSPVVFDSSEALNACPKLRDRPEGACSAVCVPVSFMGRALGVLHATGPDGTPPDPEKVIQLTTLATQAGARIGTVRAFEKTQLQASTDGLTGLVNRRTLEKRLRGMIKHGDAFALALADLDHFKVLNDTHGHEAGDRALRLFSQVAQDVLRDGDVVARWGGEEFVIALPGLDRYQAVTVMERIRATLAQAHVGDHPRFSASFGVTDSTEAEGAEQLMSVADAGLYASKQGGRDRVTIGENLAETPVLAAVREDAEAADRRRAGGERSRPSIYDAVDEEEPHPSGREIR
jgi:diguanylate cyclase (GGDEF)-like protein/PAS domain S-box-containing protein